MSNINVKKDKKKDIYEILLPSVIGIFVCVVCLVGSTFAWYSASVDTGENSITLSNFKIVALIDGVEPSAEGEYRLSAGEYTVTLNSEGTSTGGFAIFRFDGKDDVHTMPVITGETVTAKLEVTADTTLKIIASWGISSYSDSEKINFGEGEKFIYNP